MHGDEECTANLYQACVARHTPAARNREWLMKFLICAWDSGVPSEDRSMVKTCLDKVGRGLGVGRGAAAGGLGAAERRPPARCRLGPGAQDGTRQAAGQPATGSKHCACMRRVDAGEGHALPPTARATPRHAPSPAPDCPPRPPGGRDRPGRALRGGRLH
jgi:hypothetical protein